MIVVDTNVWSEAFRPAPSAAVLSWIGAHRDELFLPVTTVHELRFGIECLPMGARRRDLETQCESAIAGLRTRLLNYDEAAARAHASIRAAARRAGTTPSAEDGQIAAIAAIRNAPVATRNVDHFTPLGVQVINPWEWSAS